MGWGVDQDSSFSEILEKECGKRVLNASVSSYGTAREMKLLDQLDLSSLEYLIIQYCNNDFEENKSFVFNNYKLDISSKQVYKDICEDAESVNDYFFMKHTSYLGNLILLDGENKSYKPIENFIGNSDQDINIKKMSAVDLFINTLLHSDKLNQIPRIIIFPLDEQPYSFFIEDLRTELSKKNNTKLASKITLLDNSEILQKGDYYILDQHIKSSGHQKIASSLKQIILDKPIASKPTYFFNKTLTFEQELTKIDSNNIKNTPHWFKMDSTIEWGPTMTIELSQQILDSTYSTIEVDYEIQSSDTISGMLVVSIDGENNVFWYGKKTSESHSSKMTNGWDRVSLRVPLYDLKEKSLSNDKLNAKIFYWNINKEQLLIDNFNVRLRKEQAVTYRFNEIDSLLPLQTND